MDWKEIDNLLFDNRNTVISHKKQTSSSIFSLENFFHEEKYEIDSKYITYDLLEEKKWLYFSESQQKYLDVASLYGIAQINNTIIIQISHNFKIYRLTPLHITSSKIITFVKILAKKWSVLKNVTNHPYFLEDVSVLLPYWDSLLLKNEFCVDSYESIEDKNRYNENNILFDGIRVCDILRDPQSKYLDYKLPKPISQLDWIIFRNIIQRLLSLCEIFYLHENANIVWNQKNIDRSLNVAFLWQSISEFYNKLYSNFVHKIKLILQQYPSWFSLKKNNENDNVKKNLMQLCPEIAVFDFDNLLLNKLLHFKLMIFLLSKKIVSFDYTQHISFAFTVNSLSNFVKSFATDIQFNINIEKTIQIFTFNWSHYLAYILIDHDKAKIYISDRSTKLTQTIHYLIKQTSIIKSYEVESIIQPKNQPESNTSGIPLQIYFQLQNQSLKYFLMPDPIEIKLRNKVHMLIRMYINLVKQTYLN